MSIDLDRLIRFSYVAEDLSFTKAAKRLNVDQPWLSRQINQLEDQLGYKLFERTTRRVVLTTEGKTLLRLANELAATSQQIRALARSLSQRSDRTINVGVTPFGYWISERHALLEQFTRQHSGVSINLLSRYTPLLLEELKAYRIDVAIIRSASAGVEDFEHLPIHRSAVGLLVPTEHPLAARPHLALADLAGLPLAMTGEDVNPVGCEDLAGPFVASGMVAKPTLEGRSAMLHYARQNRWFALGFIGGEGEASAEPGFVYRRVVDVPPVDHLSIVRNVNDDRDIVRRFWDAGRPFAGLISAMTQRSGPAHLAPVA